MGAGGGSGVGSPWGPVEVSAHPGEGGSLEPPPSPPRLRPTGLWFNKIQIFRCLDWPGSRPRDPFESGFLQLFSSTEMPAFLCLTKTNKPVQTQRLVRYKVLRRRWRQILLWGKKMRQNACVLFVVWICCVFQFSRPDAGSNDIANKRWEKSVGKNTAASLQPAHCWSSDP